MSTLKLFGILVSLIVITIQGFTISDSTEFLQDFLKHENQPTALHFLHSCPSVSEKIKIHKKLRNLIVYFNTEISSEIMLNSTSVLFLIDLDCSADAETFQTVDDQYLSHPYRWIIFRQSSNQLPLNFYEVNALVDSNIILADWLNSTFTLSQCKLTPRSFDKKKFQFFPSLVYKVENGSETIREPFGIWNSKHGLIDHRQSAVLSKRRSDLRGAELVLSFVLINNDSINHLTDYK